METGGWLDQLLLNVLGFLNQGWLDVVVTAAGSFAVVYLARTSPKHDWAFVKEGPGAVISGACVALATLRSVPRLAVPATTFTCDHGSGLLGIPQATNCRWSSTRPLAVVHDYSLTEFWSEYFGSLLRDLALGLAAGGLAILAAALTRRMLAARRG